MRRKTQIFFNGQEVEEVLFEVISADRNAEVPFHQVKEYEKQFGCALKFHLDLNRHSTMEFQRLIKLRTPAWRGVKTIQFFTDQQTFRYEGLDVKGKKLVTIMFPLVNINYIQAHARQSRIRRLKPNGPKIYGLFTTTAEGLR
ncbi:MAG: hypothetical protein M3P08_07830 [Thermoproteota archaeon]|nr:hypothetical protein [Thermoproteota archaeon]